MTLRWVVIGAGSAGCVAASRLSAEPAFDVTLLEAGPALDRHAVPAAIDGDNFFDALAAPGRTFDDLVATRRVGLVPAPYARGRGVGGSSAVNAMVALRGDPALYESWGWTDTESAWDRVLIPAESAEDDELGPVDRALLQADPRTERAPLTRRHRRRVTSAEAYLWPVLDRTNVRVAADVEVARVVVEHGTVVGVELADGSQIVADRVVVAAGAIHSPALLQRSDVRVPGIGTGLQDHPSAPLTLQLRDGVEADASGLALATLLRLDVGGANELQLLPMNHLAGTVGEGSSVAGFGLLMVALMTPRSRAGTVTWREGLAQPIVDVALLSDPADLTALAQGVRVALGIVRQPAFDDIVERVYIDDHGTSSDALNSDVSIERWLQSACGDYVHASGTCAMGRVVDSDGAVLGVRGLYVCDASVFPSIPNVNTHLPTTMLAERLSARWLVGHDHG